MRACLKIDGVTLKTRLVAVFCSCQPSAGTEGVETGADVSEGEQGEGVLCACKAIQPMLGKEGHEEGVWTV